MPTDSLQIGASGMDAYQSQIDVISNNIANAGTTAYKSQNMTFQDLFYATQQASSAPTKTSGGVNAQQIGIGVKTGAVDTNNTQGGVNTTGINTNMMINGDGYFILANSDGTGAPEYTRNGDFSLSSTGQLFDPSSGKGVMGFSADSTGYVDTTVQPGPLQIPIGLKSQATATGAGSKFGPTGDKVFDLQYGGNLDSSNYAAAVSNGAVQSTYLATAGTTVYDSLGNSHLMNIAFSPVINGTGFQPIPFQVDNAGGTAVTAATEWSYNLTSTDGTTFGGSGTTTSPTQYIFFDAQGNYINTSGTEAPLTGTTLLPAADVHSSGSTTSLTAGNQLEVAKWGTAAGGNNSTTTTTTPGPIGIDFSLMSSNANPSSFNMTNQDGFPPGTLSNISVGQDGTITGAFTNGQAQVLGKVALAVFQNEGGLTRNGASTYSASPDSGPALLGTGNSGRYGSIVGDSLEMSNVSITDEFTKLISAQNAFTANSKSISTANNDLQTVLGLIH